MKPAIVLSSPTHPTRRRDRTKPPPAKARFCIRAHAAATLLCTARQVDRTVSGNTTR
ncbi:hypothetical protein ml_129 [Mollivirus sibericum]|uniref:hypothetical protein n=1 Tax=Mollivirus sibericum TaxID=1678078 RepID=UPI0006B2E0D5|nr:hypothetical protein ml_129 [Mollivirus sibericum]ALD61931.1 hypothetical protein ml_129 [Mollivirus sibericum]